MTKEMKRGCITWSLVKDICGVAVFMLSLYMILMWGYVLEGVVQ